MSKTNHARPPRSAKAKRTVLWREWDKEDRRPRPTMGKRQAIEEGIVAYLERDEPAMMRDCETDYFPVSTWDEEHKEHVHYERATPRFEPDNEELLAEWEFNLLYGATHLSYADYLDSWHDERAEAESAYQEAIDEFWDEEHDRWDLDDIDDIEEYDGPMSYSTAVGAGFDPLIVEDDEGDVDYAWLPLMTVRDAYDVFGDAFLIEGPKAPATWTWGKRYTREGYYRVWELAKEIGVTSKDLVRWLRLNGEYVKTHQSIVAEAVYIDLVGMQTFLQDELGRRPDTPVSDPSTLLRQRLINA